mmetsp:Transcript_7568/g.14755  ORF Transcript_7568/g.14755 Transcript_7568/m.14755 type:complete len:80 (+) Transcript_7568:641-880(+)
MEDRSCTTKLHWCKCATRGLHCLCLLHTYAKTPPPSSCIFSPSTEETAGQPASLRLKAHFGIMSFDYARQFLSSPLQAP